MTKQEKDMWIINIENSAAMVCSEYGRFFVNCGGQKLSLSIMKCVTE